MKKNFIFVIFIMAILISYQLPAQTQDTFRQDGIASWYGREFDGRPTASGEIYDSSKFTAAHPNLPFGTMLTITNQHNNRKVTVRVNDRGPFVAARIIDISRAAAEQLDMIVTGTAPVVIETVELPVTSVPAVPVISAAVPETPQVANTLNVNQAEIFAAINSAHPETDNVQEAASTSITIEPLFQIKLIPDMQISQNKTYRLQVGSFRVARNAVEVFERLKNAGLSPAYERFTDRENNDFFRVVLPGIPGANVKSVADKLSISGFWEAIIREEN
ncbi:MAG: septal ring lytic transglycosylase RlpA family protein [Treponema sp.]|nr:septal ring lytic transglycosylase RlpA family protein [Treponema sp.]